MSFDSLPLGDVCHVSNVYEKLPTPQIVLVHKQNDVDILFTRRKIKNGIYINTKFSTKLLQSFVYYYLRKHKTLLINLAFEYTYHLDRIKNNIDIPIHTVREQNKLVS
jgi:hypothetical protein